MVRTAVSQRSVLLKGLVPWDTALTGSAHHPTGHVRPL